MATINMEGCLLVLVSNPINRETGGSNCLLVLVSNSINKETGGSNCLLVLVSNSINKETGGSNCLLVLISNSINKETGGSNCLRAHGSPLSHDGPQCTTLINHSTWNCLCLGNLPVHTP